MKNNYQNLLLIFFLSISFFNNNVYSQSKDDLIEGHQRGK
jgi:hypothetical protein